MASRDTAAPLTPDEELADYLGQFWDDPLGYVMAAFPWDTEASIRVIKLAQGVDDELTPDDRKRQAAYRERFSEFEYGPDLWACDFLEEWGKEIRARGFDPEHPAPVDPLRFTTVSGHEIGKTCLVAWIIKFIMDTRPGSKGSVTAMTDEQLRTKTWAELGKWHYLSLTEHWFKFSSARGSMSLVHADPKHAGSWRCDAKTCREEKSEAFAGQHAPTATSFYIFDEASGIAKKLFEVREGGMTSGEPMAFDFGNGTRNSGQFYENCTKGATNGRYITRAIDSRTVAITNKRKIEQDRIEYGEDSDYFRVRWRGLFPDQSTMQFISGEVVEQAMARDLGAESGMPVVIGVDVARFGDDDTVIYPRWGDDARSFPPKLYHGLDTNQVVAKVSEYFNYFVTIGKRPAMLFIDEGYNPGVADNLKDLGYPVTAVSFQSTKTISKPQKYRFKMDEMWSLMRQGMERLRLPSRNSEIGDRLYEDLTHREYGYTIAGQKIALESKAEMKKRGVRSPDLADALALTYASEVAIPVSRDIAAAPAQAPNDWDPYAELRAGG